MERPPNSIESDIDSPCIDVCMLDRDSGLCRGCHRTIAEIS
jgi:predicted Fe-S protein YdhL (DUF1289 family)